MGVRCRLLSVAVWVLCMAGTLSAAEPAELTLVLRRLSPDVFSGDEQADARQCLGSELRSRLQKANGASRQAWLKIDSREQWQDFRDDRVFGLKHSLGTWPTPPKNIRTIVASTIKGDGFVIENIVYESRPGWWVTANLYRPAKANGTMPGIIISHSHHRPKEHGELQDMGMTWARAGCLVLVPDHLGHGERGQHGLKSADDFPHDFAVSRQDYYFRFDSSIQLYLAGESLMGWMAWDLMRGVDVLMSQDGIDKEKIILLGAVAGGGDPCAVTAALDERITCAVPFNFGGPQPETRYPLPEDAETLFNYAGSGSWESTRNLADSATSNWPFLPWEIVSSIAPRRLIYAHEFNWHRERDPVWNQLERIYELYDAEENLASTHGRGEVRDDSNAATHCTHIGKFHRVKIHAALKQWYGIDAPEFSDRRDSRELTCWTPELREKLQPQMLHELLQSRVAKQLDATRARLSQFTPELRRSEVISHWERDDAAVAYSSKVAAEEPLASGTRLLRVRTIVEEPGGDHELPALLLLPNAKENKKSPLVVGIAQGGKAAFLKHRSAEVTLLLNAGIAVFLPDVRGVGELGTGEGRSRTGGDTSRAATALMVGETMIEMHEDDFQLAVAAVMKHPSIDSTNIAFWGDSFAGVNPADTQGAVPRRIDGRPRQIEPLGPLLALLGAANYSNAPVFVRHGLARYTDVLDSPFVYLPLDTVQPGMFHDGDIPDLVAALAPSPICLAAMVDGWNRPLTPAKSAERFAPAVKVYADASAKSEITFADEMTSPEVWLIKQMKPE